MYYTFKIYSLSDYKDDIIINNNLTIYNFKEKVSEIINYKIYEYCLVICYKNKSDLLVPSSKNLYDFLNDDYIYNIYYIRYDISSSFILSMIYKNIIYDHYNNSYYRSIINNNISILLELLDKDYTYLNYLDENMRDEEQLILYSININGLALYYASDNIKKNKDIVLKAINNSGLALEYVSKELSNDLDIVLPAIKKCGFAYMYVSEELKDNKDLLRLALKYKHNYIGSIYKYASKRLRDDEEILLLTLNTYDSDIYKYTIISHTSDRLQQKYKNLNK